jgi:hypothetical protein
MTGTRDHKFVANHLAAYGFSVGTCHQLPGLEAFRPASALQDNLLVLLADRGSAAGAVI